MQRTNSLHLAPSILVVDDDEAIRLLVTRVLTRAGFDVTQAADGRMAIEKLRTDRFDAIVLDLMMPNVDGFEVLRFLKEQLPGRKCVIVASAAAETTIANVDASVVHATVRKPFDLDALVAAVQQCAAGA